VTPTSCVEIDGCRNSTHKLLDEALPMTLDVGEDVVHAPDHTPKPENICPRRPSKE